MPATSLQEEEHAASENRRNRTELLSGSLAAIAAVLAVLTGVLPSEPAPVAISAEISHTGGMDVTFKEHLDDTTSPTCGCYRRTPIRGWQGIVLPARELIFGRSAGGQATQYDVFNPSPSSWGYAPGDRGTIARIGKVLLPSKSRPTTRQIQRAIERSPNALRQENADIISITTLGVMSAASLGPMPVAALGVPAGTSTRMKYVTSSERPSDPTLTLTAGFAAKPRSRVDNIPTLDILGPQVLLWAPTHPKLTYTRAVWQKAPRTKLDGITVSGRTFNAAIRFEELSVPAGYTSYTVMLVEKGAFAVRIVPRPGAGHTTTTAADISEDAGQMLVTVPRVASQADELVPVFKRADANPKVVIKDVPFMSTFEYRTAHSSFDQLYVGGEDDFELPPTPPESGINIFGKIAVLRLSNARGDFTIGTKPLELRAKTPLELRNFDGVADTQHRLLVPIRLDADGARFDVQGRADTRLNGEPLATSPSWIAGALTTDTVTLICALAMLLLIVINQHEARKRRRI